MQTVQMIDPGINSGAGDDIDKLAIVRTANRETDYAISLGEYSVILANTGIDSGMESGAALPDDDASG